MIELNNGYTAEDIAPLIGGEPISGVYFIESTVTGGVYVGESQDVLFRWIEHLRHLHTGYHSNKSLRRDWSYAGRNAFWFTLVEVVADDRKLRYHRERIWIARLIARKVTVYNTANLTPEDWARSISQREFTQA